MGRKRGNAARIRVEPDMVSVVPFSVARSYYEREVENEGHHRAGSEPVIVFPKEDVGQDGREWVRHTFLEMDEVRRTCPREAFEFKSLVSHETVLDIGLVDIPVWFRGDLELMTLNLRRRPMWFFEENGLVLDKLFAGAFHDQMNLVSAFHSLRTDGTSEFHYHNLIFGIRRERRGMRSLCGPLDFRPILAKLGKMLNVGVERNLTVDLSDRCPLLARGALSPPPPTCGRLHRSFRL